MSEINGIDHPANLRANAVLLRVVSDQTLLHATEMERLQGECNLLLETLRAILKEPHGCAFCDSGQLRNRDKQHDPECGFAMAAALIKNHQRPAS